MATVDQLTQALIAADKAGNADDARVLAQELANARKAQAPSVLSDVGHSILPGLAEGVAGLSNLSDTLTGGAGMRDFANEQLAKSGSKQQMQSPSQTLLGLLQKVTGPLYQSQTVPGQYARTAASFAPAAIGGPEGIAAKISSVLVPAVASETAGQATKGTKYEGVSRLLGSLGGGLASGVRYEPSPSQAQITAVSPAITKDQVAAARFVKGLMGADKATTQTLNDVANSSYGKPLISAQAIGNSAKTHLAALARREGATGDVVSGDVAARTMGAPQRMLDDFAAVAGVRPAAAQGNINSLVKSGQAQAAPLYKDAYTAYPLNPDHIVPGGALDNLMKRPSMVSAANNALKISAEEGRNPASLGIAFNPAGDVQFEKVPSWQTLDYLKRGLDDHLEDLRNEVTGRLPTDAATTAAQNTRTQFRNFLTSENPAYAQALKTSGDYLSANQAFKDGQDFLFKNNITAAQFADKFSALSATEQEAWRGGIANNMFNLSQAGRLNPKAFSSPIVQGKLVSAFGPQRAQALIQRAKSEGQIAETDRMINPRAGSPTMPLTQAADAQDAFAGSNNDLINAFADGVKSRSLTGMANSYAGRKAQSAIDLLRTRGMSIPVRDAAGQILTSHPSDAARLLDLLDKNGLLRKSSVTYTSPYPLLTGGQ